MFERTDLPDGPRVVSVRVPGARSCSAVAYVRAGSRVEGSDQLGAAHFLEHLTFKGTRAFPSTRAVSEAIEGVGGTSNAATDRESTTYWARVPGREAGRAIAVLGELITRPLLRDDQVEIERGVIVEEIRSYRDDPGEFVYNLLDQALFGDTPLGREIAGEEEGIRALDPDRIRAFWRRHYRPADLVVAVAGDLPHQAACEMIAGAFGQGHARPARLERPPLLPAGDRIRHVTRSGTQAHLCVGVPALRRDDPDTWTLELLDTILGQGMSSRLFLHLREDAGLAYDVHSWATDYADCGMLGVYAGVDPGRLEPALDGIMAELSELRNDHVPADELARAKTYAQGRLELRLEEGRHLAGWYGLQEALHERTLTLDEALAAIDAVDAEGIRRLAERLLKDESLRLAVIAPPRHGRRLGERLRLA
jgi:predicted Zn-dependent peptidase